MRRREEENAPKVLELLIAPLADGDKPHLFCVLSTPLGTRQLAIYEAFAFDPTTTAFDDRFSKRLAIRFKKLEHTTFLTELQEDLQTATKKKKTKRLKAGDYLVNRDHKPILRFFKGIQGAHESQLLDGVFVAGPYPVWIMTGMKKALRFHPMWQQGAMRSFSPFTHSSCGRGFVMMAANGTMSVGSLASEGMTYDASMLTRKIKLRSSPVHVNYHPDTGTYILVTKERVASAYMATFGNEDLPKEDETTATSDTYIPPDHEKFALQLVSPNGWVIIPNTKIELDMFDSVTCCKVLSLRDATASGRKDFVVVGISRVAGEEVTARGKVMILDVLDVVPEPGQPLTKNKFKELYNDQQKGAVTQVASVAGFLITCILQKDGGNKIFIWNFENLEILVGVAFCQCAMYITSINVIENLEKLIIIGDLHHSVTILRFVEEVKLVERKKMSSGYLGKVTTDARQVSSITDVQFYVQSQQLSFVASDDLGNIVIHSYDPDDADTSGGRVLVRRADFHLGARVTVLNRISCRPDIFGGLAERHNLIYGTNKGSIGNICPVDEKVYRRLEMLENKLTTALEHRAGLNPKAFRMARQVGMKRGKVMRNILDGGMLVKFLSLGTLKQRELARRIGTSVEQLVADLHLLVHRTVVM